MLSRISRLSWERSNGVTEAAWLSRDDPTLMLDFLTGKVSERKLRLAALAICRRCWRLLPDDRSRRAVETLERFVEGLASDQQLLAAGNKANWACHALREEGPADVTAAAGAVYQASCFGIAVDTVMGVASQAAEALMKAAPKGKRRGARKEELAAQAALFRCIFGNPFHPVALDPSVLNWSCEALPKMAKKIYEERAFELLPIVADALQEAGCKDPQILEHCRGPGPHVRGCFVVDLLLEKG